MSKCKLDEVDKLEYELPQKVKIKRKSKNGKVDNKRKRVSPFKEADRKARRKQQTNTDW